MRCLTKFHLRTIIIYVKHTFKAYGFSDRSIRWNCIDSLFIQVEKMRLQKRQKPSFTPNMYWHRGWSIELKSQAWNAISHLTKVTLLLFHPQTYWIFDENTSKKLSVDFQSCTEPMSISLQMFIHNESNSNIRFRRSIQSSWHHFTGEMRMWHFEFDYESANENPGKTVFSEGRIFCQRQTAFSITSFGVCWWCNYSMEHVEI